NRELWNQVQLSLRGSPARVVFDQPSVQDWGRFLDELERVRPDVVLVDLGALGPSFADSLRRIRSTLAQPIVIALHTKVDPEAILSAMRAGASEYLYPPLEGALEKALIRLVSERARQTQPAREPGKVLGFVSAKGGCGATTVACHVGVELQRQTNKDVLLADLDLEGGVLSFLMKARGQYSIMDAVRNIHRLDASYWKALVSNGQPHVEVIAAPRLLDPNEPLSTEAFRQVVRFVRTVYDWVVLDLGRGLNPIMLALLPDLDQAFMVATFDVLALHRVKQLVQNLLDYGYGQKRFQLILNRMPRQPDLTQSELEKVLGTEIFAGLPNSYPELYEAYSEGALLPSTSELGRQFSRLAAKIAGSPEDRAERGKPRLG
ncbi:MAG: AAA family ATPase, partial [Bryobacteraceae bacterium]